ELGARAASGTVRHPRVRCLDLRPHRAPALSRPRPPDSRGAGARRLAPGHAGGVHSTGRVRRAGGRTAAAGRAVRGRGLRPVAFLLAMLGLGLRLDTAWQGTATALLVLAAVLIAAALRPE